MNNKNGLLLGMILLGSNLVFGMENDQKEEQVQKKMKLDLSMLNINENKKLDKFEYFKQLPSDIQKEVAKWLSFRDIKNFRLANKELKALIEEEDFKGQRKLANELGLELIKAIAKREFDKAKKIIISGNANLDVKDKDNFERTALIKACEKNNKEIVKLLIDAKANLELRDAWGIVALDTAVSFINDRSVAKLLIDAKANLDLQDDETTETRLIWASREGYADLAKLLIDAGANLNLQDKNGRTALMKAITRGHEEIVMLLVKAKANLDLKDNYGNTALMEAVLWQRQDIVKLLIDSGANLDLQDKDGNTALIWAVKKGYQWIANVLIGEDIGANHLNLQDKNGHTAFMHAAMTGYMGIGALLALAKADLELKDNTGRTALDLAKTDEIKDTIKNVMEYKKMDMTLKLRYLSSAYMN